MRPWVFADGSRQGPSAKAYVAAWLNSNLIFIGGYYKWQKSFVIFFPRVTPT